MAVQVMLVADVKDIGSEGDVVSVSEGYARNCLFPRNLAAPVTSATKKRLEKIRRVRDEKRKAETEALRVIAEKLGQASCTITVKVGETDKMFGSVTAADIVAVLKTQGFDLDKNQLKLDGPIKALGVFEVPVQLNAEVSATVKVWVVEE